MKKNYSYYAVFKKNPNFENGTGVDVLFPDLPGAYSQGEDRNDAIKNAKECLALHIFGMLQDEEDLPKPSRKSDVVIEEGDVAQLISVDLDDYQITSPKEEKKSRRGGARKGGGRPKKLAGRRSAAKQVSIYLSDLEFAALEQLALAQGKTKTALLRDYIVRESAIDA